MYRAMFSLVLAALLAGCATMPGEGGVDGVTPGQLAANKTLVEKGTSVTWGGEIVAVENFTGNTVLQVIAYPLKDSGEPRTDRASLGRFLADQQGFLEPREFRPGRRVTISGPLLGFQDREIGEAVLALPALDVQQLQLWTDTVGSDYYRQPRVNVGIGTGSYGSGVGIGIGF